LGGAETLGEYVREEAAQCGHADAEDADEGFEDGPVGCRDAIECGICGGGKLDEGLETDDRYDGSAGRLLAMRDTTQVSKKDAGKMRLSRTYNIPMLNMVMMYSFFFVLSDRRNSSGIGTAKMVMSRTMLMAACAQAKTWKLMHLPVCSPSQLVQM
jgi:hypothetical protein